MWISSVDSSGRGLDFHKRSKAGGLRSLAVQQTACLPATLFSGSIIHRILLRLLHAERNLFLVRSTLSTTASIASTNLLHHQYLDQLRRVTTLRVQLISLNVNESFYSLLYSSMKAAVIGVETTLPLHLVPTGNFRRQKSLPLITLELLQEPTRSLSGPNRCREPSPRAPSDGAPLRTIECGPYDLSGMWKGRPSTTGRHAEIDECGQSRLCFLTHPLRT